MAPPAAHNKGRRQSFVEYVHASVIAVKQSIVAAQMARDEATATSWERLVHCCTALGYALALSGVVVVLAAWLSTWDWVRRDDDGVPGVNNDALAALIGGVMTTGHTLSTYCNIAQGTERPNGRGGPRYARWVLVVGSVMVPLVYAWFWALEHGTGINAWYSLVHPPAMFIWVVLFVVLDIAGRGKWAAYDRRKHQEQHGGEGGGVAGAGGEQVAIAAQQRGSAAPAAAQSSSFIADTLVSLIVIVACFSVMALCKYTRAALAICVRTSLLTLSNLAHCGAHNRPDLRHPALLLERPTNPPCHMPLPAPRAAGGRRSSGSRHQRRLRGAPTADRRDRDV